MSRKTHWVVPELPWKKEKEMNEDIAFEVLKDSSVLKASQYPLPWQVKFDWSYGRDSSEVRWICEIGYLGEVQEIMGRGYGIRQYDALVKAVEDMGKMPR